MPLIFPSSRSKQNKILYFHYFFYPPISEFYPLFLKSVKSSFFVHVPPLSCGSMYTLEKLLH